ncbi:kappa-casein precursor [Oryctolagus cuniculus]|uniref:Kappa-casein n=2 Tax=Oryctolagus cuniculus TaxID=9986 RepID=CASK_RABIT|nr:kappa-casein precursor [Oryctolagus cuniculus]P33618.1 RecName: Full=Kappa-casein; Flags: Precursor [Oryctolagus cuniculus]AAC48796.1 kappa-casein [Oryctolagus cuniculus]CAA79145.1 kappa-casein [Oryctolagus cuniculus]
MMKHFLLVVNILAVTLPFLAADIQNQEQTTCRENEERLFHQVTAPYIPVHYVMNRYPQYEPSYYLRRQAVPTLNPFMLNPYYVKPIVFKPNVQVPHWQILPNIHQPKVGRHSHPFFMAILPNKMQDKAVTPTTNTIAAVEPTPIPTTEPVVSTEVIAEASPELIISPETTTEATAASAAA